MNKHTTSCPGETTPNTAREDTGGGVWQLLHQGISRLRIRASLAISCTLAENVQGKSRTQSGN